MSAGQDRRAGPPQARSAPSGLAPEAPKLPAQLWTGGSREASGEQRPARCNALREATSVGARPFGAWVFVCGPSGSGKDSVIASAQQALASRADIVFARRFVTRPAQAGSDHDASTPEAFGALLQTGGLRWHWQAHGFAYGIPSRYGEAVEAGQRVVVNGSREHVQGLPVSPDTRVVHITADPLALAQRLLKRGRDNAEAVARRLERNADFESMRADCVIVNNGELADAGRQLADYLAGASSAQLAR